MTLVNKIYATAEELKHQNQEYREAIALSGRVLDKPFIDPDGDICLLARQFLCMVATYDPKSLPKKDGAIS
jgi:hypothetical protein